MSMVTFSNPIKKTDITKTVDYFNSELNGYYGNGHIDGSLKEVLGITNQTVMDVFNSIVSNKDPVTGQKLRPKRSDRLLFPFVASAPKCFSIIALYSEDARLFDIHTKATQEAIKYMESFAGVRKRRNNQDHTERTGNTLYFVCEHQLSRANDPQLHTHVVFFNLTLDERWGVDINGKPIKKFMALEPLEMCEATGKATKIYRKTLVDEMLKIGIPAKIAENGEVEIDGITKAICKKYSKRKIQIEKIAKNYEIEISDPKWQKELRAMIANRCKNPKSTPAIERMLVNQFQHEIDDIGYDEVLDIIISGKTNTAIEQSSSMRLLRNTWDKIWSRKDKNTLPQNAKIVRNKGAIEGKSTCNTEKRKIIKDESKPQPLNEWYQKERIRKEKENKARQEQQFYERQEERHVKKQQEEQERNANKPKVDDEIDNNPPTHKTPDR